MPELLNSHIVKTPGICGGRACIAGHRIRVADIVVWHDRRGYSVDEIVEFFPGITLAEIHAALSYYFDRKEEIDAELAAEEALSKQIALRPSKLREKLGG